MDCLCQIKIGNKRKEFIKGNNLSNYKGNFIKIRVVFRNMPSYEIHFIVLFYKNSQNSPRNDCITIQSFYTNHYRASSSQRSHNKMCEVWSEILGSMVTTKRSSGGSNREILLDNRINRTSSSVSLEIVYHRQRH
jgi:hypothetical protein